MINAKTVLLCAALLPLAGCIHFAGPLERHERSAQLVYTHDNGLPGNGTSVLLFKHNRWEMWSYTDEQAWKVAGGTYERMEDRLFLDSSEGTRVFDVHGHTELTESVGGYEPKNAVREFHLRTEVQ